MKGKKKKLLIGTGTAVALLGLLLGAWNLWFSPTRIAFVNYQVISLGQISKANDNRFIEVSELGTDDLDRLGRYDMVFINAMGLRITEEQRARIQRAADGGLPVLTTAATNPANRIVSLDSADAETLKRYLSNGGRRNYRSLLNYVRARVDGKSFSVDPPEAVTERADDLIYHAEPGKPDADERGFNTVAEYDAFLREHGLLRDVDAPRIVVTGQMGEPADLIARLEETGNVVYPVRSMRVFVESHAIDSVSPSAVINMAHGRMGDYIVDYLTRQNIPLFAPLNVNRLTEEWEADRMGMSGGFLSQSVVTPEIDGAIRPFALFAHYKDEDGLQHAYAVPERLETFVRTVNAYVRLGRKPNGEKRVAVYYYKGPGQNALTAGGMEVGASLFNLLQRMRREGYRVDGLPASPKELERMIQAQGAVFGTYAEGAAADFMRDGRPELVTREQYEGWVKEALRPEMYAEVTAADGEFPGSCMTTADGRLGVARLRFGNVVLLPQPAAGKGDDSFRVIHGTDAAPPHTYVASYLWARFGFQADALIHFGTHGSLEFTPRKQVALCSNDWPDRLVGPLPHFYVYSVGNVGEGMTAKRRSYAGLQSYLTPPFMESGLRETYRRLDEAVRRYDALLPEDGSAASEEDEALRRAALEVKRLAVELGIHRDLRLDSTLAVGYTGEEIRRIENFAEELANEKVTGQLYTMGVPYEPARIASTVRAMTVEPIAYSLLALDKLKGRADEQAEKHQSLFTRRYLEPARALVERLLADPSLATDELVCRTAGITPEEVRKAHETDEARRAPQGMMEMMMTMAQEAPAEALAHADTRLAGRQAPGKGGLADMLHERMRKAAQGMAPEKAMALARKAGASPEALRKMEARMHGQAVPADSLTQAPPKEEYSKEEVNFSLAVLEVERAVKNVGRYRKALAESPEQEMASLMNALNGGYTRPSPGGDAVANPNVLPTGRNLFAVNAEETPTEAAWEKGKQLAENTIRMYRLRHNDSIPRKVSYTLWSGEFIETGGATVAQVLYMLGVEPVRDTFGRVTDLRLIPSDRLGRPRIDVVVQTSGQLRDIAASRLFLINRAVEMAAAATGDAYENQVAAGAVEAERVLTGKGLTPKEAREMSTYRVFGGVNGSYGTGIRGMVESGDRWEDERELADVYLNNMGAFYGSEKAWETVRQFAFEAALARTDAVVQPRQSNTWGALSLDHVYEFMGGMNLAVRDVTGKEPDAYLSDYRNRNRARMQEVKEAIGVESRTTLFNPAYIREKMKGEAGAASTFAEIVRNTYGWNVMKPQAVDNEMWDEIYDVYVKDKFRLGLRDYFEAANPAALEEMTAVMLETARKGMWKATDGQLDDLARLHVELVDKHGPSCSGFVCDNAKLRLFIASRADAGTASRYRESISRVRESAATDRKGVVMKKEETDASAERRTNRLSNVAVGAAVAAAVAALAVVVRRRRKKWQE